MPHFKDDILTKKNGQFFIHAVSTYPLDIPHPYFSCNIFTSSGHEINILDHNPFFWTVDNSSNLYHWQKKDITSINPFVK